MTEIRKISIPAAFDRIEEFWSPHVAARVNGQEIRLARIRGDFEWHRHPDADEAFFVIAGAFTMRLRDGDVEMAAGDLLIVPAGVEHMPVAAEECRVLLIETAGTLNTGERVSERTRRDLPEIG